MKNISRTISVPADVDKWIEEEARKETRSTSNYYVKLAVDEKSKKIKQEAANHE